MIHPSVVLTAAHCVHGNDKHSLLARAGEWDTQTWNEVSPHQDRNITEYIVHEQYNNKSLHNDVALMFLAEPFVLAENVNTICVPPLTYSFDANRCIATGWGKDSFGKQGKHQTILKRVELPVVPNNQCETSFRNTPNGKNFKLHHSFICAGGELGQDTCTGDGGSPLVCPIPGSIHRYYQTGIVAWGIGCGADGLPGKLNNLIWIMV